jgi:hypothetical protein
LLDGPGAGRNPLAGPRDPVNLAPDSGASVLNPVTPKAAVASAPGLPGAGPTLAAPLGGISGPSRLDAFGPRGGQGPSLAPAFSAPSLGLQVTPKPAVLEFPRRPF